MSVRQAYRSFKARAYRSPTLYFGAPFILTIALSTMGLAQFTQTRYEYHDKHVKALNKEEVLKLNRDKRQLDIREEYFRMAGKDDGADDWEPKRVARPAGMPEWGGVPLPAPQGKEAVEADTAKHSSSSWFARRREVHAEERPHDAPDTTPMPTNARKPPVELGPDGKPCRACNSRVAFGMALRQAQKPRDACPADIEELGRSTWTFLHSAAAYYPDEPSSVQRASMLALLDALPHVYPCSTCASELELEYARQPSQARADAVQNGATLRYYLCTLHNEVNVRLGKSVWDCNDVQRLQHRWYEAPEGSAC
ncbi:thiol oxidase [Malassezia vespertilionis]|uniref:Sulfhydryl oxidase n=1 Tax=Malassezia vespertilionis TaxID=2020962 RepID=A0A2N1JFS6_9BASI|nr:thiol oxidase [Malassezia vespertilionis]PKI85397.1 hypothetical protein MVES_000237 [Malassezia vespertilionis]WFD04926.1 thiol oxidase [Malassezia vespertilionis]